MKIDSLHCALRCALFVLVLGVGTPMAHAQLTAEINGSVTDTSGALIPDVQITVVNQDTGIKWEATSNQAGYYTVPLLQPGVYRMLAHKDGFRPISRSGIKLDVAQTAKMDISMVVGAVTETIDVKADSEVLDSGTSSIGQVVDSRKIANLPTNGRNSNAFVALVPGVRAPKGVGQPAVDYYSYYFISINGARPNQNEFFIDGGNNSSANFNGPAYTPSMDVVQEFKVQTNNFSAENTNAAGGLVNLVTKAGTNTLHGSLYEFLRNDKLEANDFFLNRAGRARPSVRFNQFGGTVGGPVIKDKTFFFFGYEGLRWHKPYISQSTVPTAAQKAGDFSHTLASNGQVIAVYDPTTTRPDPNNAGSYIRSPFPGNIIPAGALNPVALNAAKFYPAPNTLGDPVTGLNNFLFSAPITTSKNDYSLRMDHQVSEKIRLFGRLSYNKTPLDNPNQYGNSAAPSANTDVYTGWNGAVNATFIASPSLFAEVSSAFNRYTLNRTSPEIGFDPTQLGLPDYMRANAQVLSWPSLSISGMNSLGAGLIARHGYDRFEEKLNLTKINGKHTIKFGFLFGVPRQNVDNPNNANGTFSFTPAFTQGPDPLRAAPTAGFGYASFLLGIPASGSHATVTIGRSVIDKYSGGYVQDDFKITTRLTLNLGVRYDYDTPRTERRNELDNMDYSASSTLPNGYPVRGGLVFSGANGVPRGNWNSDYNNIAPRFGFAYSLTDKTVLRGGYGIFYSQMNGGGFNSNSVPTVGFSCTTAYNASVDGGLTSATTLSNPFPSGFCKPTGSSQGLLTALGQSIDFIDRGDHTPYSQQWNFNIQRTLPANLLFEISYAGTRGVSLLGDLEQDQIPLSAMSLGSGLLKSVPNPFFGVITTGSLAAPTVTLNQLLRPYPQFLTDTSRAATYGSSIYHAMYLKLEKRFSKGVSFLASYTLSKLIDDVPPTTTGFPGESFAAGGLQNYQDRRQERALATFDTPQSLVLSYVWELPFAAHNKILGGWQVNGITTLQSGAPLGITGGNASNAFAGTQRPNWTGQDPNLSGPISQRLNQYFNTAVFTNNNPFTFGNAPRIMPNLRAPGTQNFDLSVFKNIPLRETMHLQFRAELFNLFNTPQFGFPNTTFNSNTFGQITSQANSPRDIQLALKLLF